MVIARLIRRVRPLWLREKLFWNCGIWRSQVSEALFEDARLAFAPGVRLALKPSDIGHKQIAVLGYMERSLSVLMVELAAAGGLLVDVGANYGYFTCLWAGVKKANRVLAFEASPRNLGALRHNVERNGFRSRITVVPDAAGRAPGRMSFSLGPEKETGWGGLSTEKGADTVEVEVVTLDDYCAQAGISSIAVLKIDTEGAESWVLQGAAGLLRAKAIKHIFFEENPDRMQRLGIQPGEAGRLLEACGYSVKQSGDDERHAFLGQ
jgi:FkbM family methyltransferase